MRCWNGRCTNRLSDPDYQKLKNALHALAGLATPARTTEKTESVLADLGGGTLSSEQEPEGKKRERKPGHGRNGADAFSGADQKPVRHARLTSGDICPECKTGKVYTQRERAEGIGASDWTSTINGHGL